MKSYDAIIVGAGIVGTAVAYSLGRRGFNSCVVDKLPICGYGATASSTSMVYSLSKHADLVAMFCESDRYWQNWSDYIGGEEVDERGLSRYTRCGSIALSAWQSQPVRTSREFMARLGTAFDTLSAAVVADKIPLLAVTDPQEQGLWMPNAGYVDDAQLATHNIMRAAEREGAEFVYGYEVIDILQCAGQVSGVALHTGETIHSDIVVNASGPFSAHINVMAGVHRDMKISTRAVRQEVAVVKKLAQSQTDDLPFLCFDYQRGIYLCYGRNDSLIIGGNIDAGGVQDWVDPDHFDPYLSEQWEILLSKAKERMPTLKIPTERRGVVELHDVSDDGRPIYDASSLSGFYMAVGTSGHQFQSAPVVGEIVADIISACEAGNNQDQNPIQVPLKYIDYTLNSGNYSRLRRVEKQPGQRLVPTEP